MKLRFLGTRGEIEARTRRHSRHSSLLVSYRGREVMIDCGLDWRGRLGDLRPDAIVLTHAHPDHAGGLRNGAPAPVHATGETWAALSRYPLETRETVEARRRFTVHGIELEAFPVEHSLRAPAVVYRIAAGRATVLYAPDVAAIPDLDAAMRAVSVYVGDGASIVRPIVRRREGVRIGHASIREQLDWCAAAGVGRAIFSHCGSQILRDEGGADDRVAALGRERGLDASIARDGLELVVRSRA
jgi:phosphoribosyl 1,2-cyclic phosphodiesterase